MFSIPSVYDRAYPELAWRVTLAPDGSLRWEDGTGKVYDTDLNFTWFDRALVREGTWFAIDWMLSRPGVG